MFRFLDLPFEVRLIIYEKLLDKHATVLGTEPSSEALQFRIAYVYNNFYPEVLRVNKQINLEYSAICLKKTYLHIIYAVDYDMFETAEDKENLWFPDINVVLNVPMATLENITRLFIEFELEGELPPCGKKRQ